MADAVVKEAYWELEKAMTESSQRAPECWQILWATCFLLQQPWFDFATDSPELECTRNVTDSPCGWHGSRH